MVTCGFCAQEFEVDRAQPTCQACPVGSGCRLVRCPHCGFDNPETPRWIERLENWLSGGKKRSASLAGARRGTGGEA